VTSSSDLARLREHLPALWQSHRGQALQAAHATPRLEGSSATVGDLLLDGLAALADHHDEAGARRLRRALGTLTGDQPIPDDILANFMVVCFAALALYDDVAWHDLKRRWVAQARERGAVTALLLALTFRAFDDVAEGRLEDAEAAVTEGRALVVATGDHVQLNALDDAELQVLAGGGREAAARALGAQVLRNCADKGDALTMRVAHGALAVLELSLGNYEPALRHGLAVFADEPVTTRDSEVDLAEAAVRCGDRQAAAGVLQAFSPRVLASGTLQRCRITPQLARTQLLYGEWLRRRRRRRDARDQLRTAFGMFDAMGMDAFADWARSELRATGERVSKRTPGPRGVLTAQEA
jgi:hypothetical protein